MPVQGAACTCCLEGSKEACISAGPLLLQQLRPAVERGMCEVEKLPCRCWCWMKSPFHLVTILSSVQVTRHCELPGFAARGMCPVAVCEVPSASDNMQARHSQVKEGDSVLYFKWAGDKMETPSGEQYVVLHNSDILCKT